ncbi:hypothetical protein [Streptomyces sp. WAC01280]|uniref:hypothetical protein n=1 Tax=Streptomyces sp. WAC01280 TaxID=2487424 RepID=UPI000F7A6B40|nr:hypothetical protein [Streptomyces sp. WAC01280]RSS59805.1 hypothetical protein EF909_08060 [Streptomyces sp. WAC01280]
MTTAAHPTQPAERPTLSIVKDNAPEPVEGTVVEHQGDALTMRPAWILSAGERARLAHKHAATNWLYLGWAARGYRRLAGRWIDGYRDDYPQMIRTARTDLKAAKGDAAVEQGAKRNVERLRDAYKHHRRVYSAKTGAWVATTGTAGGVVIATGGVWTSLLLGIATIGYGAWRGQPNVVAAEDDPGRIEILAAEGEPFPIADATNRTEAAECVRRALVSEGIAVAEVEAGRRYDWGWEINVRLKKGTPADLIAKAGDLETPLDLPVDGLLCQPLRTSRARATLRLVEGDPFVKMPPLPDRAPNSLRLRDKALLALRMDGQSTELSFLGLHFIVIASSGGGKSVTMRSIGDVLTACEDTVVIDLDPGGNGLEPLADAVGVRVVGADQMHVIEAVLEKLLKIAKARATLLGQLGMDDNWIPSREYPAIVALIDEYPQLSPKAKALVVAILRVGRKARVQIGLAAQEATKDSIGAAIADSIALKIVGPSRHQDIVQVLGAGAGANGWRPDRLHPAQGADPADAGKAYIMGGGSADPLIHKFIAMSRDEGKARAAERAAAGRPWIDDASLQAAGVTFDDLHTVKPSAVLPEAVELARLAFIASNDPERMTSEEIYDYVSTASKKWAPQDDEEPGKALARFQDALRKQAAQLDPHADMKTKQWRGGRGYYLSTIDALTADSPL